MVHNFWGFNPPPVGSKTITTWKKGVAGAKVLSVTARKQRRETAPERKRPRTRHRPQSYASMTYPDTQK